MSRSGKKGPYVDSRIVKKIAQGLGGSKENPLKTWIRGCQISPEFVGKYFKVHNGRVFVDIFVTEDMVGHRLGEFSHTRTFRGHGQVVKRTLEKT